MKTRSEWGRINIRMKGPCVSSRHSNSKVANYWQEALEAYPGGTYLKGVLLSLGPMV